MFSPLKMLLAMRFAMVLNLLLVPAIVLFTTRESRLRLWDLTDSVPFPPYGGIALLALLSALGELLLLTAALLFLTERKG